MARYLTKESRYVKQLGRAEPEYVQADVDHPYVIELADDLKADPRLTRMEDSAPLGPWVGPIEPRVPAFAKPPDDAMPVPRAAQLQGLTSASAGAPRKGPRAADG